MATLSLDAAGCRRLGMAGALGVLLSGSVACLPAVDSGPGEAQRPTHGRPDAGPGATDGGPGEDAEDASPHGDAGDSPVEDAGSASEDGAPPDADGPEPPGFDDAALRALIASLEMSGDAAEPRALAPVRPDEDPMVRLGQVLFFSQSLSAGFDTACGTCHHPDLGGGDGLSLSVGVVPQYRHALGPDRQPNPSLDLDPSADGGPNMHRNAQTLFNVALHDRAVLHDGRVFVMDDALVQGGVGQAIRTPEHALGGTSTPDFGVLEQMMPFPITNDNEMRGFLYADIPSQAQYREHLLQRLRGETEAEYLEPGSAQRWLDAFRDAFDAPTADASSLITLENVQRALAAYVASQVFVETPFKRFVAGDDEAMSVDAKQGATLFFRGLEDGGLGCAHCHAGDRFTDEGFANVGFPQIGRGFARHDRRDLGRWAVTRRREDVSAFRTPSLLNVELTGPYGHAGTFATLEEVVRYHAHPGAEVAAFDFDLAHLPQFEGSDVHYPHAENYTYEALARDSFADAEPLLPGRALSDQEVEQVVAFLRALTDDCAADAECRAVWAPDASLDPDGHLLVRDREDSPAPMVTAARPDDYDAYLELSFDPLDARTTFADVQACENGLATAENSGERRFVNHTGDPEFGLTGAHGYNQASWYYGLICLAIQSGGVTATYLDDDCWPDLAFTGGDDGGLVFFRNRQGQLGFEEYDAVGPELRQQLGTSRTGFAAADLDGDYRRELLIGNMRPLGLPILSQADGGQFYLAGQLPMARPTFGMAFGVLSAGSHPSLFLAHWSPLGLPSAYPALLHTELGPGGVRLRPADEVAQTTSAFVTQHHNLSPAFVDVRNSGQQDLLLSSDFGTSQALQYVDGVRFEDRTDRDVITDENGMGSAIGDYDNDGKLDWFVTSVFDPTGEPLGNWGVTGNRLYRNVSSEDEIAFEDVTEEAGVRDGAWGWGSCAADFDNDGFLDIFHVNGFGWIPEDVMKPQDQRARESYQERTVDLFQNKAPRLFMNRGDGTFENRAVDWGLAYASEGRGIACFDYDRDGDIDLALLNNSNATGLQFFENQVGAAAGSHFLSVRVVGASPNTEALGARVTVQAEVTQGEPPETLLRAAMANSNYNSQNLPDLHFGLGDATQATRLTVTWPHDAEPLVCENVAADQFLVFDQRNKVCP